MSRPCLPLRLAALLAGLSAAGPSLSVRAADLPDYLALALPISGITVDGDLSDWPREMPALPIRNEFGAYGPTDTEGTDLDTSDDLSPSFRVGYDPEEQLLYVAVEVRDDVLYANLAGGNVSRTDACEIYVSGIVSSDHTPIQYALVPGTSTYPTFDRRGVHHNLRADRRSRGAWERRDDVVTTYEWGVQVRSGLPAHPRTDPRRGFTAMNPAPGRAIRLEGGEIIGFDVVVVDGDGPSAGLPGLDYTASRTANANASWVPWGPPRSVKMYGDNLVGRLILAPEDWSAGFDSEAMEAYLEGWVMDHPHDWPRGVRRMVDRPHTHGLPRRLDQAGGPVARAEARVSEIEGMAPTYRDYPETPWQGGEEAENDDALLLIGGCLLGLAVGLAAVYVARRRPGADSAVLGERLSALESRMTDTQDVMIALSEKLDRMDARDRKGAEAPRENDS